MSKEEKSITLYGVRFSYKIQGADTSGRLAVLEVEIPPRTLVKPHRHSKEDEASLVLSGTVGVRIGDRLLEAGPGTYLWKPRGVPHALWNAGSRPATVAEILSPAGLESYFEEIAPVLEQPGNEDLFNELAVKYGLTIESEWVGELEQRYGVRLNPRGR